MQLPSIELLNAVYPTKEDSETYVGIQESTGRVAHFGKEFNNCVSEIDIHNVAHKCKEWALTKQYILSSKPRTNSSLAACSFDKNGKCDYYNDYHNDFRAETEPEAIFKACEWILEKPCTKY